MISLMYLTGMMMREEVQSSKKLQTVENQPDILQTRSASTCHAWPQWWSLELWAAPLTFQIILRRLDISEVQADNLIIIITEHSLTERQPLKK